MIKVENGVVSFESKGPAEIMSEFVAIATVIRKEITECLDSEIAGALMADAIWISGLNKEELIAAERASAEGMPPRTGEKLNA